MVRGIGNPLNEEGKLWIFHRGLHTELLPLQIKTIWTTTVTRNRFATYTCLY